MGRFHALSGTHARAFRTHARNKRAGLTSARGQKGRLRIDVQPPVACGLAGERKQSVASVVPERPTPGNNTQISPARKRAARVGTVSDPLCEKKENGPHPNAYRGKRANNETRMRGTGTRRDQKNARPGDPRGARDPGLAGHVGGPGPLFPGAVSGTQGAFALADLFRRPQGFRAM